MRRLLALVTIVATLLVATGVVVSVSAYDCAQLSNPTANAVWQAACNLPQDVHPHP